MPCRRNPERSEEENSRQGPANQIKWHLSKQQFVWNSKRKSNIRPVSAHPNDSAFSGNPMLQFMLKIHMSGNLGEGPIELDLPWMSHIWVPVHDRLIVHLICRVFWTDGVGFLLCTTCNYGHASKAKGGYFTHPIWQHSKAVCLCFLSHQEHLCSTHHTRSHWRPKDPGWVHMIQAKWKMKRVWDCIWNWETEMLWSLFSSWRMEDAISGWSCWTGKFGPLRVCTLVSMTITYSPGATINMKSQERTHVPWPGDLRNRCLRLRDIQHH